MPKRLDPRVRDMTESDLSREVVKMATDYGWKVYGIHNTRKGGLRHPSGAGWPDLVLFRPGMIMFAELKAHNGKLSEEQEGWIAALSSTFTRTYVWTPTDWYDGSIAEVLSAFLVSATPPPRTPPAPLVA